MTTTQYTIYYAGALFDHKHLSGNRLLAARIEEASGGVYRCVLPQELEQTGARAVDIRNQDLKAVMDCDLALFSFDGADLDPGQVLEYAYAKMLDIPSVLMRTDFRHGGDQEKGGDPWNLMASFFPRTRVMHIDGMRRYKESFAEGGSPDDIILRYHRSIAAQVVALLDAVRAEPPVLTRHAPVAPESLYEWALQFPGGGLSDCLGVPPAEYARQALERKSGRGLL